MKQTTAAIFQVNESQMEARLLLRRTHDRVNNLNQLIAYYWRANHDVQVRYAVYLRTSGLKQHVHTLKAVFIT